MRATATRRWKEPGFIAMGFPELTQHEQRLLGQWDEPIFAAFTVFDMEKHVVAVDVADLNMRGFTQAQATGIDGR